VSIGHRRRDNARADYLYQVISGAVAGTLGDSQRNINAFYLPRGYPFGVWD
jgi:hypothetical protein